MRKIEKEAKDREGGRESDYSQCLGAKKKSIEKLFSGTDMRSSICGKWSLVAFISGVVCNVGWEPLVILGDDLFTNLYSQRLPEFVVEFKREGERKRIKLRLRILESHKRNGEGDIG